jgi:hygromycin-B 4-O-kinase
VGIPELRQLILELYNQNIDRFELIGKGEFSKGYFFTIDGEEMVIRFSNIGSAPFMYGKDKFAHDHFSREGLLIPQIFRIGQYRDTYFAISKRAKGQEFGTFDFADKQKLVKPLVLTLRILHSTNIAKKYTGFGSWDETGAAKYNSWNEALLVINSFHERKEYLSCNFYNKELNIWLIKQIESSLELIPDKKYVVHGDVSFGNIITDGIKITGLLDWSGAQWGDFLCDYAYLEYWHPELDYRNIVLELYPEYGLDLSHYQERIQCYQYYISAVLLDYYLRSNQEEKYHIVEKKILNWRLEI